VKPLAKSGSNGLHNKVPACKICNTEKGCLSINEYRAAVAYRKGLIKVEMRFYGEISSTSE